LVLNSPRGTSDIFGEDIRYRDFIVNTSRELFDVFNYKEIITPVFEHTEVFDRGIGEGTDIVRKEMYTFPDKKGRSLTLRPEGTASVVRSIIEHKLFAAALPLKLFYIENMFRYERPQKGRMREFWQLGVEAAGISDPQIDAEVIWLLNTIFEKLGFKNLKLLVNSVGCGMCRQEYINAFRSYLEPSVESLCEDCKIRYLNNPLRIFDCKIEGCATIVKEAPKIYEHICPDCRQHFGKVTEYLDLLKIDYIIKDDLVRGFDYYTQTIFEIISADLDSAQNALGGGGRYDKLISQFGGPDMPSIGFAVGIDRTIVLMRQLNISYSLKQDALSVLIINMDNSHKPYCLELLKFLRDFGIKSEISYESKNIGNSIKSAQKNGFSHIIIIGEDEVKSGILSIKDLKEFQQQKINFKNEPEKILNIFRR
jgi:histidyl-tRNA synthetase